MDNEIETKKTVKVVENGLSALPYTAIKITGSNANNPDDVSHGTGFFYNLIIDDVNVPLIVTNKHVVDGLDLLTFHFGLLNDQGKRILGDPEKITLNTGQYPIFRHKDPEIDLAFIPARPLLESVSKNGKTPFFLCFNKDNFAPAWMRERLVASTEVLMIGFPNGLMDETNNLPLTRKGILSTPFEANYNGKPNFVVDIAAFGGSSGSPVLAYYNGMVPQENGVGLGGQQFYLLGVLHSGPTVSNIGDVITIPAPTSKQITRSRLMMHLGYCVRAEYIEGAAEELRGIVAQQRATRATQ